MLYISIYLIIWILGVKEILKNKFPKYENRSGFARKLNIYFMGVLYFFVTNIALAQNSNLNRNNVKIKLVDFLLEKNEIDTERAIKYKNGNYSFFFAGVINDYKQKELKEGIYMFGTLISHTRVYFLIVKDNKYEILDLTTRGDLDNAIVKILNFCEEKHICVDIKNEYINRIVSVYYNINRFVNNEFDVDCYDFEEQKKNLP